MWNDNVLSVQRWWLNGGQCPAQLDFYLQSLMQWRQSANDRCSGSEQAACAVQPCLPHAICSYPGPGHTCQRRPAGIETFLSSLSWLCPPLGLFTVQSGAWHWSLLTARPASVQCIGRKKSPFWEPRSSTYPSLLLLSVWGKLCFSCEHGGRDQGQKTQSCESLHGLCHKRSDKYEWNDVRMIISTNI